jgi:hypothetical protein
MLQQPATQAAHIKGHMSVQKVASNTRSKTANVDNEKASAACRARRNNMVKMNSQSVLLFFIAGTADRYSSVTFQKANNKMQELMRQIQK